MTRFLLSLLLITAAACNKPSPEDCRKALTNMQHLMGTDNLLKTGDFETEVRACRGGSSREAVECANNATTLEALRACGFMNKKDDSKKDDNKKDDSKKDDNKKDDSKKDDKAPDSK